MGIIGTIFTIIDIIALVIFLWFVLFGFVRGWKKSILNTIAFFVPFIIIICLSGTIAKSLLDVDFFGLGSIQEGITYLVEQIATQQGGYSQDAIKVVDGFAIAMLKYAIYGLAFFVAWLISLIFKLIFKLTLKRFIYGPEKQKRAPYMKERLIGLGTGALRGLLMVFFMFGPTMGLLNFTDLVIQDVTLIQDITDTDDGAQYMSTQSHMLVELHETIEDSVLYNVLNIGKGSDSGVGLSGRVFGSIFSVEIDNKNYSLIKEYGYLRQIFPALKNINETNAETENVITFSNLTDEDIETINEFFEKTSIFKVASPLILDIACNILENEDPEGNKETIEILRNIDLEKEVETYIDLLTTLFEKCHTVEINLTNPEDTLLDETLAANINDILNILLQSELFDKLAIPAISDALVDAIGEDQSISVIFTEEEIKLCLTTDIGTVLTIYQTLSKDNNLHDFLFHEEELVLDTNESITSLENSIVNVFSLSIINGNEDLFVEYLLNSLEQEKLTYETLFGDIEIEWNEETRNLASIICEVLKVKDELFTEDDMSILSLIRKDENNEYVIKDVLKSITKSELLKELFVNLIDTYKEDDKDIKEIINLLNIDIILELDDDSLYNELIDLLDIIEILNRMNFFNDEEIEFNSELSKELIYAVFDSSFVEGSRQSIFEYIIEKVEFDVVLDQYDIKLNFYNIDWDVEVDNIIDIFDAVLAFGDLSTFDFDVMFNENIEENQTNIIALLEALDKSQIFSPSLHGLINNLLKETEYDITISDDEFETIRENTWNYEITTLVEVINFCRESIDNATDHSTIEGSKVSEIMLKACRTVIATKVIGTALNELLGEDGLNLNPRLPDGRYTYDFRNSGTLKANAINIGSLIDLANATNEFDINDMNSADELIDTITTSLNSIQNNELSNTLINEYLGAETDIDFSNVDAEKESQIIEEVYDIYKADPDNFNIDAHPELKEKSEESEIANEILKLLGIL